MTKKIGTHNGTFHCDEAMAVALLSLVLEYREHTVVRTRDPEVLATCDIVVDVGGVYDHGARRYDHHQRGFAETYDDEHETKLSSSGLVYKHYGREAIVAAAREGAAAAGEDAAAASYADADVDAAVRKMYDSFLEELDGVDNGISCYPDDVKGKYRQGSSLPSRVSLLNGRWNDKTLTADPAAVDARFARAVATCREEFTLRADRYLNGWAPALSLVRRDVSSRFDTDPTGRIVVLRDFCPWKEHLATVEKELHCVGDVIFVLYQDPSGNWRVQTVPLEEGSFDSRLMLPEPWRGYRDDELSKLSGIDGCIFVHASGFIGGNKTYDGALAMARGALASAGLGKVARN